MLDFLIFAVTFLIFLILAVIYLYPGSKKITTVPGPDPVDTLEGNIPDIIASGSLHEFLVHIHETYGPIASFWYGPQLFISIGSAQLFEEHSAAFDRPYEVFEPFIPLITDHSIQVTNGGEGRRRHAAYSKCYTDTEIKKHFDLFNEVGEDLVKRWGTWTKEEFIPVQEELFYLAIITVLRSSFGEEFVSDELCKQVYKSYDVCLTEVGSRMKGSRVEAGGDADKRFELHKNQLYKILEDVVARRRKEGPVESKKRLVIDAVLDLDLSPQVILADLMTVFIAGVHTTGALLTWVVYYLAEHPDVQKKAREEVLSVVGLNKDITPEMSAKLVYLKQVMFESMRVSALAPIAARVQDHEIILGGHKIPPKTPVIHSLGVSYNDSEIFPDPDSFDPERFDESNTRSWPKQAFVPFGFAGRRKCPGYRLSLGGTSVALAHLLRSFELILAPDQVVVKNFVIVSRPEDEIWLSVKPIKPK